MAVYRFRVYIEDDHEVYRDIDVLGKQSFGDLHHEVVKSFNFQPNQPAEYFNSDQQWYEGDSVVELDRELKGDTQKFVNHVSMPRQRFVCVTLSYKPVGLAIELQKILPDDTGVSYPKCSRSQGDPPYYTQPPPEPIVESGSGSYQEEEEVEEEEMEGPSEKEIAKIQKEAEKASKKGELKAPAIDFDLIKKNSTRRKVEDDDLVDAEEEEDFDEDDEDEDDDEERDSDRGFESFDMDDLM
jgi:hypothetical protein